MSSVTIPQSALASPANLHDWLVSHYFTEILFGTHKVETLRVIAASVERLARDMNLPTSVIVPLVKASSIRHAMQLDAGFIIALESLTPPHQPSDCPSCEARSECPVFQDEAFAASAPFGEELRVLRRSTGASAEEVAKRIMSAAMQAENSEKPEEDHDDTIMKQ